MRDREPAAKRWDWVKAWTATDMPSTLKLVLHVLALHMEPDGSNCFPGASTIANEASLGRSTVLRHLRRAEADGWIERKREQRSGGSWGRTTYVPTVPIAGGHVVPERDGGVVPERDGGSPAARQTGPTRSPGAGPETIETTRGDYHGGGGSPASDLDSVQNLVHLMHARLTATHREQGHVPEGYRVDRVKRKAVEVLLGLEPSIREPFALAFVEYTESADAWGTLTGYPDLPDNVGIVQNANVQDALLIAVEHDRGGNRRHHGG